MGRLTRANLVPDKVTLPHCQEQKANPRAKGREWVGVIYPKDSELHGKDQDRRVLLGETPPTIQVFSGRSKSKLWA